MPSRLRLKIMLCPPRPRAVSHWRSLAFCLARFIKTSSGRRNRTRFVEIDGLCARKRLEKTVQPKTGRQQASTARLAGNDRRQSRLKHPLASGMGKLAADLDGSPRVPTQLDLAGSIQASPVVQAQMRMAALINAGAKPAADGVQRNAFLTQLANAGGQIDYTAISGGAASANQRLLFLSIGDAIGKCRKRQAMLEAIENAGLAAQFIAYAAGQRWTLGSLVSTGQDIRSSHSGGAIDPQLPQAAYENPAVAGGGVTGFFGPPGRDNPGRPANYAWLEG